MSRTSPKPAGARLGPEYGKLWAATAISTLGDGMYLAGLPLLAGQLSRDPLAVSVVTFASWLPWLLVGLLSGALVDRWDRRRVLWTVDLGRCVLVGALAVAVWAGGRASGCWRRSGSCSGSGRRCSTARCWRSSPRWSPASGGGWSGPTAAWAGS
jgi:MFS family permease